MVGKFGIDGSIDQALAHNDMVAQILHNGKRKLWIVFVYDRNKSWRMLAFEYELLALNSRPVKGERP
ncbi:hypothetical protein D3C78_1142610 [compost metagenome]